MEKINKFCYVFNNPSLVSELIPSLCTNLTKKEITRNLPGLDKITNCNENLLQFSIVFTQIKETINIISTSHLDICWKGEMLWIESPLLIKNIEDLYEQFYIQRKSPNLILLVLYK